MNLPFQYSILKYRPSYLLDERVNIGLLFQFVYKINDGENIFYEKKVIFTYPNQLKRISHFFPNISKGRSNLVNIKRYLKGFEERTKELSSLIYADKLSLKVIIPTEFIINDANSFFFSDIKEGFYRSIEETVKYYEGIYFKYYEKNDYSSNDLVVKKYFSDSFSELVKPNDERLKYLKEGIKIPNKIGTNKFEYQWQNGTANLIKTLGLDLSAEQSIQRKVFNWTLAINYIQKIDKYKDYHFDILVNRPKKKSLYKTYDNALDVLNDIKANKKIIEEDEIKQYAQKTLETIQPF